MHNSTFKILCAPLHAHCDLYPASAGRALFCGGYISKPPQNNALTALVNLFIDFPEKRPSRSCVAAARLQTAASSAAPASWRTATSSRTRVRTPRAKLLHRTICAMRSKQLSYIFVHSPSFKTHILNIVRKQQ
jgi:hypothetical protein